MRGFKEIVVPFLMLDIAKRLGLQPNKLSLWDKGNKRTVLYGRKKAKFPDMFSQPASKISPLVGDEYHKVLRKFMTKKV
jgi:hypothetical protein